MKLRYSYLLCCNVNEIDSLYHFVTNYEPDGMNVQIDFKNKEIEIFDDNGHLVAQRNFSELL